MDFGTFIAAFGNGYQKMLDKISTGKITFLTKPFFCRALLCAIAKNEDYVIYFDGNKTEGTEENTRTSDAFRSFYAGKPDSKSRRSLHPIAKYLINIKDDKRILDEDKFKCFLTEYTENYSADTLLENFQKLLPNTSKETLFDDITNEFVQILTEAAAKPDGRRKPPITDQATYTLECNANSLIEQIDDMLEGLIETGRKIASTQTVYGRLKLNLKPTPELWELLHRYLHRLKYLTASLHKLHSDERSTVRQLFRAVSCIEANDFVMSEAEYMLGTGNNSQVHNVEQSLSELKKDFQMQTDADRDIPVP